MEPYEILETEWARFNGLEPENMVACASGTAALHLAFECVCIPSSKELILCDYNMIACARAAVLARKRPVFVDCTTRLLIDPVLASRRVSISTSAVLATHIYGRRCDMERLHELIKVPIVEDCAEAHGVRPHPQTAAACWSFYKNKIISGEEGGAVYFKDKAHADVARELRCLGFTKDHDFMHRPFGHNYRMSNVHAHLIINNLRQAHRHVAFRKRLVDFFDSCILPEWRMPPRDANWVYDIRMEGMKRHIQDVLISRLKKSIPQVRHGFRAMSLQREFLPADTPHANKYSFEILYFPLDVGITLRKVEKWVEDLIEITYSYPNL